MRPVESRTYRRDECVTFRKTDGPFGGLSNMAPGYPLCVNGIPILTAEALYQACRFPYRPDVQHLIISQTSPMTAKMRSKPFREDTRNDWDDVRVAVMRWTLRVKLAQNWQKFKALLLETGDRPIVEDSRNDDFWGSVASKDDHSILVGRNVLGRLLMELREKTCDSTAADWQEVRPPQVSDFLLYERPITTAFAIDATRVQRQSHFAHMQAP